MHSAIDPNKSRVIVEIDYAQTGKQFGVLRVPQSRNDSGWGTVAIPIVVIANGSGPTVLFTAGNHGDEYEGQVAAMNLARELEPEQIQGRVIILPAMHFPAAMNGTRLSPIDGKDFNRCFPGNPNGSFAEILAHYVATELLPLADFQMDLHSGGHSMDIVPSSVAHQLSEPAAMAKSLEVMAAFGAPVSLVLTEVSAGPTLLAAAERLGLIALSAELGGLGRVAVDNLEITERGVRNVLKYYGVLEGKPEQSSGYQTQTMTVPDFSHYIFAPSAGLFQPYHAIGQTVEAGQPAGRLLFIEDPSRPPLELAYKASGMLWCTRGSARVQAGDPVAVIAVNYS
ncbi:MAG: succinylglutamate desuccinylase/aspartoacylase family protein [Gammaproteobacteria bacterium]